MERKFVSLSLSSPTYPILLKEIPDAPEQLFVVGTLPDEQMMAIAIVGTRKATVQGRLIAKRLAKELASRGVVIVSGLALGIDTAAHEGALEARGKTLAVLANGLDTIYPSQNTGLADAIIDKGGALFSEYPLGTPSFPSNFIARNRIVSGLSIATIVIEAPDRSGTLATARFALEQGREVFVVPGPADHPNYVGSYKLIRDGARLITSVDDIWEDLSLKPYHQSPQTVWQPSTPHEHAVVTALTGSGKPLSVDKLAELTNMEAQCINATIATLVMAGVIKETERGYSI